MVAEKTGAEFYMCGWVLSLSRQELCAISSPVGKAAKPFQDLGL